MTELIKLTAVRNKVESGLYKGFTFTSFYKPKGKLFATFPPEMRQPRKGSKTIILNCWKWAISEWIDN